MSQYNYELFLMVTHIMNVEFLIDVCRHQSVIYNILGS